MKIVDFSNPYLRGIFPSWLKSVECNLDLVTANLATWAAATEKLEDEAAKKAEKQPRRLAIVLDLDETIWCNMHANAYRRTAEDASVVAGDEPEVDFSVARELNWSRTTPHNPLLPGARALLDEIQRLGLALFFISGRLESQRARTIANLVHLGLAGKDKMYDIAALEARSGMLRLCPDAEDPPEGQSIRPFKEAQRKQVNETHRVLLNVGDQVSDMGYYSDRQVLIANHFYRTP